MRHRLDANLSDTATVTRSGEATETTDTNEPVRGTDETVAEDVPCMFDSGGTAYERADSGDRVERPATIVFPPETDIREGDRIEVDGVSQTFEVRETEETQNHRHGTAEATRYELERRD